MVEKWNNGLMVKVLLTIKLKLADILLKTNLPVFHHSIIPSSKQAFNHQENINILIKL